MIRFTLVSVRKGDSVGRLYHVVTTLPQLILDNEVSKEKDRDDRHCFTIPNSLYKESKSLAFLLGSLPMERDYYKD